MSEAKSADHDSLTTFEVLGQLYHARYRRLRPGKDESAASGRSSMDDENLIQFDNWMRTQFVHDACARIQALEEAAERACSAMGCFCADDKPNVKCAMCTLEKAIKT